MIFVLISPAIVQMTIMQIIDMAIVDNGHVTTLLTMHMGMFAGMSRILHSGFLS